jgi:hypothetical protein
MKLTRSAKIAGSQDFYTHGFEVELDWEDVKGMFSKKKMDAGTKFYCLQWYGENMLFRAAKDAGLLTAEQEQDWAMCCSGMHQRMTDALSMES